MNTSRRYFRLTGSLHQMADQWKKTVWTKYVQDLKAFYAEVGTDKMMCQGRRIIAITSEVELPGMIPHKSLPGYSKPDMRTKAGRDMAGRFKTLDTPIADELLSLVAPERRWIIDGNALVSAALSSIEDEYYVSVPSASAVEYHPLDEMVEIFEWEYLKKEAELKLKREAAKEV